MKLTVQLLLLSLTTCGISLRAQTLFSKEFGKITQHEADMTSYEKDPEAEAVVLFEEGHTYFLPNDFTHQFDAYMDYRIKIKVLKQAGISWGNFTIPYYKGDGKWEDITQLEGITYNYENGVLSRSPLDNKNVFTEKLNNNWNQKTFAMPNVKEGSIIDLRYTIVTPYLFNLRTWYFQKKIPVVESIFNFKVLPYYEYTYIVKRAKKFDISKQEIIPHEKRWGNLVYKEVLYTFGLLNVPAFKDETFITSEKDYLISMNLQLSKIHHPQGGSKEIMSTWPAISAGFLKADEFGKYIKNAEKEGKKIIPQLGLTEKTVHEKIKTIIEYVKHRYNYNGQHSRFTTGKLADFLKEKSGNCADINLFTLGLLQAAGIEAKAVLLSTRSNGAIDERYPFEQFFNYTIIQVRYEDKTEYFDATERLLTYNELPERCMNVRGFVLDQKAPVWVDILQDDLALTEKQFEIECNSNPDALKCAVKYTAYASDAYNYRRQYNGEESNLKNLLQKREITPAGKIQIENELDLDKPFVFSFETEYPLDNVSGKLFIAPFLNQSFSENLFKQTTRTLPVDLIHRHAAKYHSIIRIPDGYEVESLPRPVNHNGKIIIKYNAQEKEGVIEVNGEYQFKQSIYEVKDYAALKGTVENMVNIFSEMIVLKKKD